MSRAVPDAMRDAVISALIADVRGTIGESREGWIRPVAQLTQSLCDDASWYAKKVVDDIQQRFHDEFVDTTWPACPVHAKHPLEFVDGAWRCPTTEARVAALGSLAEALHAG